MQSLSCRHSNAHAAKLAQPDASPRARATAAKRKPRQKSRTRNSPLSNASATPAARAKIAPSKHAQAGRRRVCAGIQQQRTCSGWVRAPSVAPRCELDQFSWMNSRRRMPNAVKPPARPRRHEARRAAASMLVHSGRNLPTSHCGNAISCTHRRRHERISSKRRGKACEDGGNSGGIGSDELSSMGGSGKVLGEATRSSCTPHRRICRRRSRRRGRR